MQTVSKLKFVRMSPQKGRLVADMIRGMPVERALNVLRFDPRRASRVIKKVLESAIANAENNDGADVDELRVKSVMVDVGPVLRRFQARAKGRGTRISKRTSHVTVLVSEEK